MIKVGGAMLEYAEQLERERGISKDMIMDSLKEAMVAAYRRYAKLPDTEGLLCKLVERTGEIGIFERKLVVDELVEPPEPVIEIADDDGYYDEDGVWRTFAETIDDDPISPHYPRKEETEEAPVAETDEDYTDEPEQPVAEDPSYDDGEQEAAEAETEVGDEQESSEAEPSEEEAAGEEPEEEGEYIPPLRLQILLKDARKIQADITVGDWLEIEVTPSDFGRIAAQSAKQVIMQRIREAEKVLISKDFEDKQGTVVPGIVQRLEGSNVIVNIGHSDAVLPRREQLSGEYYRVGNKLRVYVLELKDSGRIPQIIVSQAHPQMVREVFELEVPEIEDGLVEIKAIAREAGHRTKVAVDSPDGSVDPQGACIGTRGSRIQAIVNELRNEKIDIIRWAEHPAEFIVNALAPARILEVRLDDDPDNRRALVIVPDDQLSLAIGREGQNVRLAAKLTGFKLDIKSITQFEKLREAVLMRRQEALLSQEEGEETVTEEGEVYHEDAPEGQEAEYAEADQEFFTQQAEAPLEGEAYAEEAPEGETEEIQEAPVAEDVAEEEETPAEETDASSEEVLTEPEEDRVEA